MRAQLLVDRFDRRERVRDRRNRLIGDAQFFPSARAFAVRDARVFSQPLAKTCAVVDEHRAALRHAQVEFRQSFKKRWILFAVAQDARFVFVGPVIVGEGLGVARAQLAERHP